MRKTAIAIVVSAAVLVGSVAVVSAAETSHREVASAAGAKPERIQDRRAATLAAVRCRNLSCLNRKLTYLFRTTYKCQRIVDLTRYRGYLYTPDGSNATVTTALDYTGRGSTPTDQFVVYVC